MRIGAFTWYLTMTWLDVTMVAPLLLCAVDGGDDYSGIAFAGTVVSLSILGAHIEPLILQFGARGAPGLVEQLGMHLQFYNFLGVRYFVSGT